MLIVVEKLYKRKAQNMVKRRPATISPKYFMQIIVSCWFLSVLQSTFCHIHQLCEMRAKTGFPHLI